MSSSQISRRLLRPNRSLRPRKGLPPATSSHSSLYLPKEVKLVVFGFLQKYDLKSVRLVCKEWSLLATLYLFDKIYISPREKDIEVFERITRHPILSQAVKELVHDTSLFVLDMSLQQYCEALLLEVMKMPCLRKGKTFMSRDPEINQYVEDLKKHRGRPTMWKVKKRHMQDNFIAEGHLQHIENAEFQHRSVQSGMFFSDLCSGLHRLSNLRHVVLSDSMWHPNFHHDDLNLLPTSSGSPLARNWHPFHVGPGVSSTYDPRPRRSEIQFSIMTHAISATARKITSFELKGLGAGLPPEVLTKPGGAENMLDLSCFLDAFSGLTRLELDICPRYCGPPVDRHPLHLLQELLAQIPNLKRFHLSIQNWYGGSPEQYYDHAEIFPANGLWPNLMEFSISGISIPGRDLLSLLRPRAKTFSLELGAIEITEGTWEGVIEGMRRTGLRKLCFTSESSLLHCGGALFRPREPNGDLTCRALLEAIEEYVVHGGQHPCLPEDCDPDMAESWHLGLFSDEVLKQELFRRRENGDTDND